MQKFDATTRFAIAIETRGVIVHFADPEVAIRTEIDGYGINHERLASSQFYLQVGFCAKSGQSFGRILRRRKLGLFSIEMKFPGHGVVNRRNNLIFHFGP